MNPSTLPIQNEFQSCLDCCLQCLVACELCATACLEEEDCKMMTVSNHTALRHPFFLLRTYTID
jgi:hypothetical protein